MEEKLFWRELKIKMFHYKWNKDRFVDRDK